MRISLWVPATSSVDAVQVLSYTPCTTTIISNLLASLKPKPAFPPQQVVCRPRVSNTPPLPPCYEVRTHLRPILHMVLRHLLIASQLQLLASPPPPPPRRRATTTTGPAPLPSPRARTPHPFVVAPVAQWQEEDGGLRGRDSGGLPVAASLSAGAAATGEALGGSGEGHDRDNWNGGRSAGRSNLPKSAEAAAIGEGRGGGGTGSLEEGDSDTDGGDRQERDWHGTSSDAFEIAVAVLKVRLGLTLCFLFRGRCGWASFR